MRLIHSHPALCQTLTESRRETGQKTFYTVQLYLPSDTSGSDESFLTAGGGATRFWNEDETRCADVEARPGRVLVFQHDELLHSGEEVCSFISVVDNVLTQKHI